MGHPNTALDAARRGRGSPTEQADASWSDGENSSFVPCVILKRKPTLTARRISITRFTASGIGSRAQNHHHHWLRSRLDSGGTYALCGYRSRGRSLGRATPMIQARPVCR